ncbi:hypothetical protein MY5147_006923 [Beauveria neobassiana]
MADVFRYCTVRPVASLLVQSSTIVPLGNHSMGSLSELKLYAQLLQSRVLPQQPKKFRLVNTNSMDTPWMCCSDRYIELPWRLKARFKKICAEQQ